MFTAKFHYYIAQITCKLAHAAMICLHPKSFASLLTDRSKYYLVFKLMGELTIIFAFVIDFRV